VPFELDAGQEAVAKGMSDLAGVGFALFQVVLFANIVATTWASYVTRIFPRWYAHLGVAVGALNLVGSLGSIWTPPWLAGGGLFSCLAVGASVSWTFVMALLILNPKPQLLLPQRA
jgi:MFS family permease